MNDSGAIHVPLNHSNIIHLPLNGSIVILPGTTPFSAHFSGATPSNAHHSGENLSNAHLFDAIPSIRSIVTGFCPSSHCSSVSVPTSREGEVKSPPLKKRRSLNKVAEVGKNRRIMLVANVTATFL
ncbi:hypothetical protein SESBI_27382 [Sesbania bispinosa]|nr:hypothetical protein SESBI_27382 [Sesbania bispinosa]